MSELADLCAKGACDMTYNFFEVVVLGFVSGCHLDGRGRGRGQDRKKVETVQAGQVGIDDMGVRPFNQSMGRGQVETLGMLSHRVLHTMWVIYLVHRVGT